MITVFAFCGEKNEADLCETYEILKKRFRCAIVGKKETEICEGPPQYLLLSLPDGSSPQTAGQSIVLLFEGGRGPESVSDNAEVLSFSPSAVKACSERCQLISCGLHRRDTFTLSSLDEERPVFSVQRQIKTLSGEIVEVGEYPLSYGQKSHTALIAAAGIMLLSGETP